MDQEKIGKFIAEMRIEKKLTQKELAEKLGVSDRSVGNWENARNLPDLSLFKPLCSLLDITLTELINGERIKNEDLIEKSDEVLASVMEDAKTVNILQTLSTIIIAIAIVLFFIPILKDFNQTLSIVIISLGLFLLSLGLSLKLTAWKRINHKVIENTGMGFASGLTLLFIALKLTDHIDWTWLWVLSPLWIAGCLSILFIILALFIAFLFDKVKKKKQG